MTESSTSLQPPSHRTFTFGPVTIDSDFDSGNCSHVEKITQTNYNIWIGSDHPKNNYRAWFHFSIKGLNRCTTVTFNIKNMQNQSRLLYQGLVPVYREEDEKEWKRIEEKVNTAEIEIKEDWIEWKFRHTMTSSAKVFIAIFYPWSNVDNHKFLDKIQEKSKENSDIYFYRSTIIQSLEKRPVQFLVLSSNKYKTDKEEKIVDDQLFKNSRKPYAFTSQKKAIVLGARVHPGQVPGSHVLTGILEELVSQSDEAKILRDTFVFYVFPIFNPDGVARGHYRVDTNGINLNRCYLSPSATLHPPIYAVKKIVMHLHSENRFYAFLDLHAHASRKGNFIYGNSTNQLIKQVETCIFPKILSLNSMDFQYEGSDFTEQNMYWKDKADHMSKEASGRVAIFRSTKNAFCWTLECNYNMSRVHNVLENKKKKEDKVIKQTDQNLSEKLLVNYRYPSQKQAKEFYTIETYQKLGRQICESFLDLVGKNPYSRIENPKNYFKSVHNVKMQLAVALLKMAPNRFEVPFRKIYNGLINTENSQIVQRSMKALYYVLIKNAKIENMGQYQKKGDLKISHKKKKVNPSYQSQGEKQSGIRIKKKISTKQINAKLFLGNEESISPKKNSQNYLQIKIQSEEDEFSPEEQRIVSLLFERLKIFDKKAIKSKPSIKAEEIRFVGIHNVRQSMFVTANKNPSEKRRIFNSKFNGKVQGLPMLSSKKDEREKVKRHDSRTLHKIIKNQVIQIS